MPSLSLLHMKAHAATFKAMLPKAGAANLDLRSNGPRQYPQHMRTTQFHWTLQTTLDSMKSVTFSKFSFNLYFLCAVGRYSHSNCEQSDQRATWRSFVCHCPDTSVPVSQVIPYFRPPNCQTHFCRGQPPLWNAQNLSIFEILRKVCTAFQAQLLIRHGRTTSVPFRQSCH